MTIQTNIPAIPIKLLDIALSNVFRFLYNYAYISLPGYITKHLVILQLEDLRSLLYEYILKINIPKIWAEKPPSYSAFSRETRLFHMWNMHCPHNTNQHSDSSYPNIFFRLSTLSPFQNTHI